MENRRVWIGCWRGKSGGDPAAASAAFDGDVAFAANENVLFVFARQDADLSAFRRQGGNRVRNLLEVAPAIHAVADAVRAASGLSGQRLKNVTAVVDAR